MVDLCLYVCENKFKFKNEGRSKPTLLEAPLFAFNSAKYAINTINCLTEALLCNYCRLLI